MDPLHYTLDLEGMLEEALGYPVDAKLLNEAPAWFVRRVLEEIFEYCFITEDVLDEVRSDATVAYVSHLLAEGFLVFYPFRRELEPLVRRLVDISARDLRIRVLDPPEAYALAIGVREGAVVLTENKGVLSLVKLYPEYSGVRVWRSLEVLREAYNRGLVESLEEELRRYERETGHRFPRARRGGG